MIEETAELVVAEIAGQQQELVEVVAVGPQGPAGGGGGGGGPMVDATTTSKGAVQLAGDLAGTAAAPTVPGLTNKANATHTHTEADVIGLSADLATKASAAALATHVADTANPHQVTKSQVGLGNVTDDAQLRITDLDIDPTFAANSDAKVPSQKAVKTAVDGKAPLAHTHVQSDVAGLAADLASKADASALTAHTTDTANPHAVTKAQIGLSNVTDDAQLTAAQLDTDGTLAANSDLKVARQKAVKTYVDDNAGGGGGGLWQELDRVSVPIASPVQSVSLTVAAGDWMQLRVRYVGACTTYTLGARLLTLNVNNQPSGIWEGDGLFHSKGFQVTPGSTWGLNISGAGNAHTGTSAATSIPVGAIYPDSWHGRSHGEVTITQDDKLTSVYAVARNNTAANGTFQVYNNGYAVYTSPITSVQLAAYNMAGLFVLEGRAAQPTILPLDPGSLNTDPAFTNNSNVQVPTQRAVRTALDRQPFALMPPTRFGAGSFLGTRLTGIKSGATCSVTESRSALGMTTLRRGTIQELAVNILTALPAGQKGDICCYSVDGSGFPALLQWTQQIPLDTTGDVAVTGLNLPIPNTGKWAFALWSRPGNGGPVILTGADAGTELGTQTYSGATMSYQLRPSNGILPPDLTSWPAQGGSGINVLGGFSVAPMILARGVSA